MSVFANVEIRAEAKRAGVMLWEIAERLGINDGNFSRKLRHELPANEKDRIMTIIEALAQEKEVVNEST